MRVLDPTIDNTINIVLRKNSTGSSYTYIYKVEGTSIEFTDIDNTITPQIILNNMNRLPVDIVLDRFSENQCVSLKVIDNANNKVARRCKLFFTSQVPQNYNING